MHGAARAAFVAEVIARDALLQLLRSCEACLQRRLAATGGCLVPRQPAAEGSTAGSRWQQRTPDASGAAGSCAVPAQCTCSNAAVRLQPRSSPPTAAAEKLTLQRMADGSVTPRIMGSRVSTPRRHHVPPRQSRSAHDILQLSSRQYDPCSSHHRVGCSPTEAADAAAALAAMCGTKFGAEDGQAPNACSTAACAARLLVVQWLAEHAFGAGRMMALQACRQAADELLGSDFLCSISGDMQSASVQGN